MHSFGSNSVERQEIFLIGEAVRFASQSNYNEYAPDKDGFHCTFLNKIAI